MGRTTGELDNWIVPKRCNVYQTLAFIAVLDKYPACLNFSTSNQSTVATKMRVDFGASKSSTMQPQAARTTKALAQYMGFITENNNRLEITEIGYAFLNNHRADLINKGYTLKKPNPVVPLIENADEWKSQMIKLQLTNPSQPKCENVSIYPFRYILKLLNKLQYIDVEEMALFVLTSKSDKNFSKTVNMITNFRTKKYVLRNKQVEKFKSTKFGNIALEKAPSAAYFMALCEATGLIERKRTCIPNPGATSKKTAIYIKSGKQTEVNGILTTYGSLKPLVFNHDERKTWDYYFCQDGINYPIEIEIRNQTSANLIVKIENTTKCDANNQEFSISSHKKGAIYAFPSDNYIAHIYDMTDVNPASSIPFTSSTASINITSKMLSKGAILSKKEIISEIKDLTNNSGLTTKIQKQLDMYTLLTGKTISDIRMYRGAYLEYYYSLLFEHLKKKKIIDDYQASLTLIKPYNLPHPAASKPDFVLTLGKTKVVLEVTLMKPTATKVSKNMKMEIEGAVNHMQKQKIEDLSKGMESKGIFAPGAVNKVVTDELKKWATAYKVTEYKTINLNDLINLFEEENRVKLENFLK
ncbi:AlwI family type II restriction endonuclease [Pseudobutyrivibrio ruminis]|uniref:AlwI family type II restriction endonuclease n=1 Tax=Pseudobutyrivibrio ruminis TaxID=46206 RepID=UPI00051C99C8|nr:AlwI family type II restriction endonuclease [Pseudobutyrivibrio ruminis]